MSRSTLRCSRSRVPPGVTHQTVKGFYRIHVGFLSNMWLEPVLARSDLRYPLGQMATDRRASFGSCCDDGERRRDVLPLVLKIHSRGETAERWGVLHYVRFRRQKASSDKSGARRKFLVESLQKKFSVAVSTPIDCAVGGEPEPQAGKAGELVVLFPLAITDCRRFGCASEPGLPAY